MTRLLNSLFSSNGKGFWRSLSTVTSPTKNPFPFTKTMSRLQPADDYLYEGYVNTFHFQTSLPLLPVPKISTTIDRFLKALEPISKSREMFDEAERNFWMSKILFFHIGRIEQGDEKAKVLARREKDNNFGQLQSLVANERPQLLLAENTLKPNTSYISKPWFDMYLGDRRSVVLHHNPFMMFCDETRPIYSDQLVRSTNMTIATLKFLKTLQAETLEPEVFHLNPKKSNTVLFRRAMKLLPEKLAFYGAYLFKAFPLDMSQYGNLFCSTRIPCGEKDKLYKQPNAKHILVGCRGHFFSVQVLDENGNIYPAVRLLKTLQHVRQTAHDRPPPAHPIGQLSGMPRDRWAALRRRLEVDNKELVDTVDSSIFFLGLDDYPGSDSMELAHLFLHGHDGRNRWFDKSVQLLVTSAGHAATHFEHSWGDGVAVLRWFQDCLTESTERPAVGASDTKLIDKPGFVEVLPHQLLDWHLDDGLKRDIEESVNIKYRLPCEKC